jgi:hypothetical protein
VDRRVDQAGAHLGYEVAGAGDLNGDGFDDVAVAAMSFDNGPLDEGRLQTFHGSALGLETIATSTIETDQPGPEFGLSLSAAGDVYGDGFDDLVVGAPRYDNGELDGGAAFVYHGSPAGLETVPAWTGENNQSYSLYGTRVAGR